MHQLGCHPPLHQFSDQTEGSLVIMESSAGFVSFAREGLITFFCGLHHILQQHVRPVSTSNAYRNPRTFCLGLDPGSAQSASWLGYE